MLSVPNGFFANYWSPQELAINLIVFSNLFGALLLGLIVGYERTYHGRAAGMRTYGLVCMASCAVTVIVGYPAFWYGGLSVAKRLSDGEAAVPEGGIADNQTFGHSPPDPTRVIQGIVTGVGFLGAGVIMKDGFSISGLTTAASIWSSSAIGILVGIGFYSAAILLTILSAALMMWAAKLEQWLPSRPAVAITLCFRPGFTPREEVLSRVASERGYQVASGSFQIHRTNNREEWRYVAIALNKDAATSLSTLAAELGQFDGVEAFHLSHARN